MSDFSIERHNILNNKELHAACQHLKDILGFVKMLSKDFNIKTRYSTSHEWPTIEFYVSRTYDKQKKYFIKKIMFLSINDYKYPPIYKLWVAISNDYGFMEIIEALHSLFKKDYLFKREYYKKDIGNLEVPINREKLRSLFNQGVKFLTTYSTI